MVGIIKTGKKNVLCYASVFFFLRKIMTDKMMQELTHETNDYMNFLLNNVYEVQYISFQMSPR